VSLLLFTVRPLIALLLNFASRDLSHYLFSLLSDASDANSSPAILISSR